MRTVYTCIEHGLLGSSDDTRIDVVPSSAAIDQFVHLAGTLADDASGRCWRVCVLPQTTTVTRPRHIYRTSRPAHFQPQRRCNRTSVTCVGAFQQSRSAIHGAHVGSPERPEDVEVLAHDGLLEHAAARSLQAVSPVGRVETVGGHLLGRHILVQHARPLGDERLIAVCTGAIQSSCLCGTRENIMRDYLNTV